MIKRLLAAAVAFYISSASAQSPMPTPEGQITPAYPIEAQRSGRQGKVVVRAFIDINGRPTETAVQTSSGFADLDNSALDVVRAARFRPAVVNGKVQPAWVIVPIDFVLKK